MLLSLVSGTAYNSEQWLEMDDQAHLVIASATVVLQELHFCVEENRMIQFGALKFELAAA